MATAADGAEGAAPPAADQELLQADGRLRLLLQWAQAVCSLQGLQVLDLSKSFADGQALCLVVSPLNVLVGYKVAVRCQIWEPNSLSASGQTLESSPSPW